MGKKILTVLGGLVGLAVLILLVGALMPSTQVTTRRVLFKGTPELVFNVVANLRSYPTWRRNMTKIERLADLEGGREVWREHYTEGSLDLVTDALEPPRRMVRSVVGEDLPFSGGWEVLVQPVKASGEKRTRVSITETSEIHNVVARLFYFVAVNPAENLDQYLASLGDKIGQDPVPAPGDEVVLELKDQSPPPQKEAPVVHPFTGWHRVKLMLPGERGLPFYMRIPDNGSTPAEIVNGTERIKTPWEAAGDGIEIRFPHFDSVLSCNAHRGGIWTGEFALTRKGGARAKIPVAGVQVHESPHRGVMRFTPGKDATVNDVAGTWKVKFERSGIAKAVFTQEAEVVHGTILTPTGDYRYLAGVARGGRLQLSVFDGSHAFLFEADITKDGKSISGDFLSGNHWMEKFTAERSEGFALPDPLKETKLRPGKTTLGLEMLQRPSYRGRPIIITLFGSWCPNCHDEAPVLQEVFEKFRTSGLAVIGLAYEHTDDPERSRKQVDAFRQRTGIGYETVVVGLSDKTQAATTLPALESIKAFPTTIFLNRDHTVRAIHTGFSGPATGDAFEKTKAEMLRLAQEIVDSKAG